MNRFIKSVFLAVVCCYLLGAPVTASFGQQTSVVVLAPTAPPSPTELEQRQEAFRIVWETVNELFYDPKFGGVDWAGMRTRYEPRVATARSNAEFHQMLQQMVNELHQSHFMVVPRESIPKIRATPDAADDPLSDEDEPAVEEDPLDTIGYKLTDRLLTGIGIDLRVLAGSAVITRVVPGSPAARAGLRPGFVITRVGHYSMGELISEYEKHPLWGSIIRAELPILLVAGYINGEATSSVRLGYLDGQNHPRRISIRRERLNGEMSAAIGNLPAMYTEFEAKRLAGGVGYIRFNAFVPPLMAKLCGALRSMKDAPGIILDLRGNQGGLLGMVGGLSGLLDTNSTFLGSMQTRGGVIPLIVSPQASPYSGPLVILIDGSTQSAGEMFASGFQESDRAILVGDQSAGNTLPSAIKKLPTGAIFQYGFADYETRSGKRLEGRGVTPNVSVPLSRRNLLRGNDPQLTTALRSLRERIALATRPNIFSNVTVPPEADRPAAANKPIITVRDPPLPPPPAQSEAAASGAVGPKASLSGTEIMKATADNQVKSILEKFVTASGGKEAFDKIKNRVSTGTIELTALGMKGTVEIVEESPNKSSTIINAPGLGIMQRTFDGTRAWLQDPLQGFIRFTGMNLEMAKDAAIFNRQARLPESYSSAVLIGKEKVAGKDAQVVRLGFERWYFDVESGLLLRRGNTYYEDYREVDGVKLPFKIREEVFTGAAAIYELTEIKHNVKIDETKFSEYPSCFTKP
ncbi:MAG TPA: S41 family peptidase [Pyrinomonadaceae bacterium]|nr:S41 family peptidase [Pyrinomonadaceae bacterium]